MKIRCARPNCRKRVKFDAPTYLCSKHWKMWWWYGVRGRDTWWLRAIDRKILGEGR